MTLFASYFDLDGEITYLHTPGSGLIPAAIKHWRQDWDREFYGTASMLRERQTDFLIRIKADVSRFFGAEAKYTFLVPGFSVGFNTVLAGLPTHHRFLLLDEDYPSVNFPIRSRGFEHETIPVSADLEEQIRKAIRRYRPTIFAFSLVQYISGIKLNPGFIRDLRHEFPELLLFADGTQYCGTEEIDFADSGLDFMGASGYKWLLSGFGNGFVLLSERLAEMLYPGADKRGIPHEPFLTHKSLLSIYFEPGHQDNLSYGTLQQSLLFLEALDRVKLAAHLGQLKEAAQTAFEERGLLSREVSARKEAHSTIFNLLLRQGSLEKLIGAGIYCSPRGSGVRVGFHLYNDLSDLECLLAFLDQHKLY